MPDPQQMSSALLGDPDPWVSSPLMTAGGPAMAQALGGIASNMASLPQQAFEASEGLRNTGQYNPAPIVQAAQLLMGGGAPAAEAGAAGVFGGKLARTSNPEKLMQAGIMEGKGAHSLDVYHETGWFRGTDGQWRFEIPDLGAGANVPASVRSAELQGVPWEPSSLGEVLHHPALYEAYPNLSRMEVGWNKPAGSGGYTPASKAEPEWMDLSLLDHQRDLTETSLHEAQHAIQNRELFSPGASSAIMTPYATGALRKQGAYGPDSPYAANPKALADLLKNVAYQAYHRTAGETEARNVVTRYPYSSIERKAIPPWETEDVKRSQQFILPPERHYP